MPKRFPVFSLACLLTILVRSGQAAPVTVGDHSFEDNNLSPGQWNNSLAPEWQETNGPNSGNGFEEYLDGIPAADGTDFLGMEQGHMVWQDLAISYQANTRYTLRVAIGNRSGRTAPSNISIYRLADTNNTVYASGDEDASSIPQNSFAEAPALVFDTNTNPSAVGQTIRVQLLAAGGGRSHFDNIRLEEEEILTGVASLENEEAIAITTTGATLRGEVAVPGNDNPSITFFYGVTNEGNQAANWDSSIVLPGTHAAEFSTSISGLSPGTAYYYAARATNSGGTSWALPAVSFSTLAVAPTMANGMATEILGNSATLTAEVTANGGDNPSVTIYYGTTDGGNTESNWDASLSLGTLSATGSASATGLLPGQSYFFRARGENSGGIAWATSSSTFSTPVVTLPVLENRDPSGVTANTASLRGEVIDSGSDSTAVTLHYGPNDGGSNPGAWAANINVGMENGNFSRFVAGLSPQTTYYYTSSGTNAAGVSWASPSATFTTPAALSDQVVINEIHYDPEDETSAEEFIELHNPGANTLDLSGWSLSDAVTYRLPPGTTIAPGGFLVIGQNPATLQSTYGVDALGPWTGGLNNEGESIELIDGSGTLRDEVTYGSGFPWPTASRGGGSSAELMHPALDNDLGGSWRSSGSADTLPSITTHIPEADSSWSYRKGTSEASTPIGDWRLSNFVEDGSWLTGQTPIGYGDNDDNTTLSDMRYNYSSVYLRRNFTLSPSNIPSELTLRLYVDDGAVVWINGIEVARVFVGNGQLSYNDTANNHEASWQTITLTSTQLYLNGGTNTVAIHALNQAFNSSDFSIDASLRSGNNTTSPSVPTPGSSNSVLSTEAPPQIRQVNHSPESPRSTDDVVITAKVTDPEGINSVSLEYQLVAPGSYLRQTDAAYETSWTAVSMVDNGGNGDVAAGDFIYTATLPASLHNHRQLVRYRIVAEDGEGLAIEVPYSDDEQPNFAYYVYNGVPSWTGSFTPTTTDETFPSGLMNSLPVYQIIAQEEDVIASQYNSGSDGVHMKGTLVYDGKVYDHIEFENRGEASTYQSGKNKWRIHFNRARRFQGRDNWGRLNESTVNKLNFNACASPWAAVNRGMAGLDETVSFRLYELAGVPSPRTHYFSLRVVDNAAEASPTDQFEGDLWGLYVSVEQPGGKFLDDRNLADGNVYKIEGGAGDKKEQGDTQTSDSSDWNSFYSASNSTNTEQWWRDNMHLPSYYSMRGLNRLLGNVDIRIGFNHYFYHEPTAGQWWPIPWDLDMMYIAETHQAGVIRQQNALNHPQIAIEFRNRSRELLDLVASDSSLAGGQIGQLVGEYAQMVNPTGQSLTWADADAFMWNQHPRTRASGAAQTNHKGNFFATPYTDSRFGGSYLRTLVSSDHEGFVKHITDYLTDTFPSSSWAAGNGIPAGYGYEYLKSEASDGAIPDKPSISYSGVSGYPVNGLSFQSGGFSDPNGNSTFGKMRWRAAQIAAPGLAGYVPGEPQIYEIETTFASPDLTSFQANYQFPASALVAGNTYRVRVQHEDSTGRTSHWSDAIEFVANGPDTSDWTNNLMVTELMYHPAAPNATEALVNTDKDAYEFIELTNISETLTLDLSDISFTDGIDFDFGSAAITSLAPGQCLLLVKNQAAFEARYGTGFPIAGVYPNSLSNGGETIEISFAVNTVVRSFTYDDGGAWPDADGTGYSLELVDAASAPDHGLPESWALSNTLNGSPCQELLCPSFEDWQNSEFSSAQLADANVSSLTADPDGDGMDNLMEYSQGTSPLVADELSEVITAGLVEDAGDFYLAITFKRLLCQDHLSYLPEVSTNLQDWEGVPLSMSEISAVDNNDGTETVTVRSNVLYGSVAKEFIRLRVLSN